MEFNTNTGDCFISDKALASMFGVSEKTISRAIKSLEDKKLLRRETKNVKGGKERHLQALSTDNLTVEQTQTKLTTDKMSIVQQTICPLYNGQNDLIKDNIYEKDNSLKDNIGQNFGVKTFQEMNDKERKEAFKELY